MAFGPMKRLGARHRGLIAFIGAVSAMVLLTGARPAPKPLSAHRAEDASGAVSRNDETSAGPWPQLSQTCVLCHGFNGSPLNDHYPRLAGQPAAYIVAQLRAFASGARKSPTMAPLAMALSSEEIDRLSQYFAAQTPAPFSTPVANRARPPRAEAVVARLHCAACHGGTFAGHATVPALAAQSASYLTEQLSAFRTGIRRDPTGAMNALAAALSPQDIDDIAACLAQMPEPAARHK